MLILDTLLLSPIYGTIWAARQVHNAIKQDRAAEPARLTAELSELYMMLETHRITEGEFDAREKVLLDQLDLLQEDERPQEEEEAEEAEEAEAIVPEKPQTPRARRSRPKPGGKTRPRATGESTA